MEVNKILTINGSESELCLLRSILDGSHWELYAARTVAEAMDWLVTNKTRVLLCAVHLPDGEWCDVLRLTGSLPQPPLMIVLSRRPHEQLWHDVLEAGAYDVLPLATDHGSIRNMLAAAWRSWRTRS